LDRELARDLMSQTRIFRLLEGYRNRRPADFVAIADAITRLSQLVVDCPAITELDINPLLADETGVVALDARISIEPSEVEVDGPTPGLAIRPYPNQWERWADTESGERIFIRPIRPADEHLYGKFVAKVPLPRAAQGILPQVHREIHADRLCPGHGFRGAEQQ